MARRSLKPQLNQIRTWVRQGRTDAWIAHQLEVSVKDVDAFKREHELVPSDQAEAPTPEEGYGPPVEEEPDLRAEDDALVAAALDAEPEEADEPDEPEDSDDGGGEGENGDAAKSRRRRGRRGGRGRRTRSGAKRPLEGTFDHGDEGYGLWLDPAVQDDPVYAEHWAGHRPVVVTVEQDQIVIKRAGEQDGDGDDDDSAESESGSRSSGDTDETPALDPDAFDS
ncbi:MAG: hypothetical protein QOG63_2482 [Thermoleophilaceae bacterium]|jgi:hypothetical protein|nr:hypothetical protein [Thermoleophilaceae bacterium]